MRTPCALVDLDLMEANARAMRDRCRRLGVSLRPHVKTHKSPVLARLQLEGLPKRITVSTLAEARAFALAGFDDQCWALPLPMSRIDEALELASTLTRFRFLVDSPDAARALSQAASARGITAETMVEIDVGAGRSGIGWDEPRLAENLADIDALIGLAVVGLLTHGGHSYASRSFETRLEALEEERDRMVFAARVFESSLGREVSETSIGSTPGMSVAEDLEGGLAGITEVRPGNYLFFDLAQVEIGSCTRAQIASSCLATVISRSADHLVIDAGALALSKDQTNDNYGELIDQRGRALGLELVSLSQEHGIARRIASPDGPSALTDSDPTIGQRLRVLPAHSCLMIAAHDRLITHRGELVIDELEIARGW